MFYITFHGGSVGTAINNVHVYDLIDGQPVCITTAALQTPPGSPVLSELRDLVFGPSGNLFVINGYKDASQVLRYRGIPDADHRHAYQGIYADARVSDGIVHPFALAFDGSDNGYLSSQDSNVVTALKPPRAGKRGEDLRSRRGQNAGVTAGADRRRPVPAGTRAPARTW